MYNIEHQKIQNSDQVKLTDSSNTSCAVIVLDQGASLQQLTIKGIPIIEDLFPLNYTETYASSILFPFANRVKDGVYTFNEQQYQLDTNHKKENNALHGFVFDKTFKILSENVSDTEASITLEYEELQLNQGFPFTYTIQVIYTLKDDELSLNVFVKNTDSKPFPFTIGWHPYFTSKNLHNSVVKFDCSKKVVFDDRLITTDTKDYLQDENFQIKDQQLDDCFILNSNEIHFLTPAYNLEIKSSSKDSYLQLYTPPKKNVIAIEPTTGISDSFNNKIGLQLLEPGKTYRIDWSLVLKI